MVEVNADKIIVVVVGFGAEVVLDCNWVAVVIDVLSKMVVVASDVVVGSTDVVVGSTEVVVGLLIVVESVEAIVRFCSWLVLMTWSTGQLNL